MKKLLTAILIAASAVTMTPIGKAEAVLSNCGTGVFYKGTPAYAYGALSWCNSGTGTQRIRIKCYVWNGSGTWYTKNGPYVNVTKTSAQWCNGSDMLMDKWIQFA